MFTVVAFAAGVVVGVVYNKWLASRAAQAKAELDKIAGK